MQSRKKPLLPSIIFGRAGGEFSVPVVSEAQSLKLPAHFCNIAFCPISRRHFFLYRGIFCRESKGVPSHGLQDILPHHALIACDHICNGVIAHMPHVKLAAGVGEHCEAIELFTGGIDACGERAARLPRGLNFYFKVFGLVFG